jgi:amino acid adenylation domain-containing protein
MEANTKELLLDIRRLGVTVEVVDGKLRTRGPRGALDTGMQARIAANKSEILEFLTRVRVEESPLRGYSAPRTTTLPLSFAQQRLWFLDQLEQDNASYNMPYVIRLSGDLDQEALEASINDIVRRHEILRTNLAEIDEQPVQLIAPPAHVPLPLWDLTDLAADARESRSQAVLAELTGSPFTLERGALMRVGLLRLAADEHIFALCFHHIISDGWSMSIFAGELAEGYAARVGNRPARLPELPVQYADFAHWQRTGYSESALARQLSYWTTALQGAPALLALPTDRPRPPVQTYRGGHASFQVPASLVKGLRDIGERSGATLFMTLLSALNLTLMKYSNQHDICVGTPIANRPYAETERLIGFFANTLVLRTHIDQRQSFTTLLEQTKHTALDAYKHQEVPFERVVEALNPERHLSHSPLFQVMFALQSLNNAEFSLPGLQLKPVGAVTESSKFDLSLTIAEGADVLGATIQYNADLFDKETIERIARNFLRVLGCVVREPERPLQQLSLLDPGEYEKIVYGWTNEWKDSLDECIHERFEQQARRVPDRIAIIDQEQSYTYAQLNALADGMARRLRRAGVGADKRVCIFMDRSAHMVAAVLAVIKAGGAYVPLDPALPAARRAWMLQDALPTAIVTDKSDSISAVDVGCHVLLFDETATGEQDDEETLPLPVPNPDNLAYVMYTSGSSGRPKGVMVAHRGLINRFRWQWRVHGYTEDDCFVHKSPCSFDTSVWEMFLPLSHGAKVVVAEQDGHRDPVYLKKLIEQHRISVIDFVPSMLQAFLAQPGVGESCSSLKHLILGGEALEIGAIEACRKVLNVRIYNQYGPTEASIGVSAWICPEQPTQVSIGRPIDNTQLYILDPDLNVVPISVEGELCIGGASLARGYLNNPALTAQAFVPDPFSSQPGRRLYRTGDRARFLPDGNILYCGRMDRQVKIRGMRVELSEIESVLLARPEVREAAVVVQGETERNRRLVAYIVSNGQASDITETVRTGLTRELPEYMVPSHFVMLDELPLSVNGKLDRNALPKLDIDSLARTYVAPRTPCEEIVAQIWADVLNIEQVGIHNNFFELGGHSLLGTRVISKIRSAFEVECPLRALFEAPTVEALARRIDQLSQNDDAQPVPPIASIDRSAPLPLSFSQQRLWFLDQIVPGSALYNMPTALKLKGLLDLAAIQRALDEVLRRHEILRTRFALDGDTPVQIIEPASELPLTLSDLSTSEGDRMAQAVAVLQRESSRPFDLSAAPLIRAHLVRLAADEHMLLLNMHHIVSDAWSMGVLAREVTELYAAFIKGSASPLPAPVLQYGDFAHWQRTYLSGEVLERQRSYWAEQLRDAPPLLTKRKDHPRPAVQSHKGAQFSFLIPANLTRALNALSRKQNATLFMTLTAAYGILLARYSGQNDVCVGTPIANRTRTEIEPMIGFFVNTLVLRMQLDGPTDFAQLLAQVRATALGAYGHQDLPFEYLVEQLQPHRNLSHSPLFQAMIVLQNSEAGGLSLPELEATPVALHRDTAKFDLSLYLRQVGDEIRATFEYCTDLFEPGTIERLAGSLARLLQGIVADPATPVHALPLLGEREHEYLLHRLNATQAAYPRDKCIHELFEEQAAATPDKVAVVFDDEQLTYAALNARANRLAHYLRAQGVRADSAVGLCLERGIDMIVGLLGILKAGGAYVPLDPVYPEQRLAYIVESSGIVLLLTQQSLQQRFRQIVPALQCVALDSAQLAPVSRSSADHNPERAAGLSPTNLAYVIFTSGSTGQPKGVMIEHRNTVAFLAWASSVFSPAQLASVLVSTSVCFDLFVFEVFAPLVNGGRAVVVNNLLDLQRADFAHALSLINTVPSVAKALKAIGGLQLAGRSINLAGEPLDQKFVNELYDAGAEQVHDLYGPTEATTYSTYVLRMPNGSASIGRPISNTTTYVLNSALQPVPAGVAGELYIGGAGVARGYLNHPDLTAERFVSNPFVSDPNARMYRTGDLVRYLPNGNLEYLGRIDDQVKIRGFRIELGEIEEQLLRHGQVESAVVLAREDVPGEKRLVAYVAHTGSDGGEGDRALAAALRDKLRAVLPEYMVPAVFMALPALPLNANGKIDKKALPVPDAAGLQSEYVAPETETEQLLAAIWAEVLHLPVEKIGASANFFALGGHSLLLIQVLARLQQAGLHSDVRTVFGAPDLAALAALLDDGRDTVQAPFVAPANLIPAQCEAITPEMLPLVELNQDEIDRIVAQVPGGAANVQDLYRLAPPQEGILLHHLMHEQTDPYIMPVLMSVETAAQLEAFLVALQAIVDRQDALRTAVISQDISIAVQVVLRRAPIQVTKLELDPSIDAQQQLLARMIGRQRMDLTQAPLLRVAVAADLQSERHTILLQWHHIVCDHVGLTIIGSELHAALSGKLAELPAPVPYREFVAQALHQARHNDAEAFFRNTLGDVDEPTAPYGLLDVHGDGSAIVEVRKDLDTALAQHIRQAAKAHRVSPATLFHTAWAMVLAACSGRDDVVFGTVLSGRLQGTAGAGQTLGMFINTLPLRLTLRGKNVLQMVAETESSLRELLVYEQASLALAQRCSSLPGGTPLFSAMLNYRHSGAHAQPGQDSQTFDTGLKIISMKERTNYPFSVAINDQGEGFAIDAQIDRSVDAQRVVAYIEQAMKGIVEALRSKPETLVLNLPVLPASESEYLLHTLNATQAPCPPDKYIHQLFEEQAAKTPDNVAVVFEDERLTYAELNTRANRMAHYLREQGVQAESLVGLCVERGIDMIVGLLGILKAGGAYVPLDPSHPPERLGHILADSAPFMLLTLSSLLPHLPASTMRVVQLDSERDQALIAGQPVHNPGQENTDLHGHRLAYVIYTSGSTGRPKGVMIEHASLAHFLQSMSDEPGISAYDRLLAVTTIAFDIAALELYLPLISGAQLVLAGRETLLDPERLLHLISEHDITVMQATPATWQMLLDHGWNGTVGLKALCGGEALPTALSARLLQRVGQLWNMYGPTEATVWCACREVRQGEYPLLPIEPIGKPVNNTRMYILNAHLAPVPLGVTGELYIGGALLARAYLNRADLTAERFIADPFDRQPDARLYRTGDLTRYLPDGMIAYEGRNDLQIKIRGFRIEPGEIEAALCVCPGVRQAVVLAREDVPGDKRLVAYVACPGSDDGHGVEELAMTLRSALREALPEYMVPAVFMVLPVLPLNTNGKIDRKALPAPDPTAASRPYHAPHGHLETTIAQAWEYLLNVKQVDRRDNFFELGGHSLVAIRLISYLAERNVQVSIKQLFFSATLADLAEAIEQNKTGSETKSNG